MVPWSCRPHTMSATRPRRRAWPARHPALGSNSWSGWPDSPAEEQIAAGGHVLVVFVPAEARFGPERLGDLGLGAQPSSASTDPRAGNRCVRVGERVVCSASSRTRHSPGHSGPSPRRPGRAATPRRSAGDSASARPAGPRWPLPARGPVETHRSPITTLPPQTLPEVVTTGQETPQACRLKLAGSSLRSSLASWRSQSVHGARRTARPSVAAPALRGRDRSAAQTS